MMLHNKEKENILRIVLKWICRICQAKMVSFSIFTSLQPVRTPSVRRPLHLLFSLRSQQYSFVLTSIVLSVLDTDKNGYLDFKEFQQVVRVVSRVNNVPKPLLDTQFVPSAGCVMPNEFLYRNSFIYRRTRISLYLYIIGCVDLYKSPSLADCLTESLTD